MAGIRILRLLMLATIARCRGEPPSGFHKPRSAFGELLKPPPPPLSKIVPMPFHTGQGRVQRQNQDLGYSYQPPPPLPPSQQDFKFPAPFYKQYSFNNYVPPPQPFTTPSTSLFQKVSGWLFPSQQTEYDTAAPFTNEIKKDCNPCNSVPWIPVIKYNLSAKNLYQQQQNSLPTYGPPSPTAIVNSGQFRPQPFSQTYQNVPQDTYGVPSPFNSRPFAASATYVPPTYGPPSPTHILESSPSPLTSTYSISSSSYSIPSSSYGVPSSSIGIPSSSYGVPSSTFGSSSTLYNTPSSSYGTPSPGYGFSSASFSPLDISFTTSSSGGSVTPNDVDVLGSEAPPANVLNSDGQRLPKINNPTGFRNSYGEPLIAVNSPYPVSATAAESSKIRTEVLPSDATKSNTQNGSLALANPAPFSLKGGRNIHTLQPVALPNLSVSPLPPIFNARPFRPVTKLPEHVIKGLNQMIPSKNVNVAQSLPLAEFTHSIDYPPTFIQSPIIDVDKYKNTNQTKANRNLFNPVHLIKEITAQASEDHLKATNSNQDVSFETTGFDYGNDLFDMPKDLKNVNLPQVKNNFADLRGMKDEDVDKFRTENNLQDIDSPLLYLKPSAPHKDFSNFVLAISTPASKHQEFEIYDDYPTTATPQLSTVPSSWDESRTISEGLFPPNKGTKRPKVVQIVIPYTTGNQAEQNSVDYERTPHDWHATASEDDYQARKVPTNTENYDNANTVPDDYSTASTTTEEPTSATDYYESTRLNTPAILNDLYDVREPPFDIIKFQHSIDEWTEQEYSNRFKPPKKNRNLANYAKTIPDEYFTTTLPVTEIATATSNYIYEYYDHEGSSSMQHTTIMENKNETKPKGHKIYNTIERIKNKHQSGKNEDVDDEKRLHIYTAASSFRSTTTTAAPWGMIQTSISPLTKEKVYVVTSKPWRETENVTNDWYAMVENFESKRTGADINDVSATGTDNLPFKSPRFLSRPDFTGGERTDSVKPDSSYGFSRSWHQSINDLDTRANSNIASSSEGSASVTNTTNLDETTNTTRIAEQREDKTKT